MILARLKSYLGLILAALTTFAIAAAAYFRSKAKRADKRADIAEAALDRHVETQGREKDIDEATDERTSELAKKIEAGEPIDLTRWGDESE